MFCFNVLSQSAHSMQCCTLRFVALPYTGHLTMLVKVIKTNGTSQPDHQGGTNKYIYWAAAVIQIWLLVGTWLPHTQHNLKNQIPSEIHCLSLSHFPPTQSKVKISGPSYSHKMSKIRSKLKFFHIFQFSPIFLPHNLQNQIKCEISWAIA